jgi:hypothetical protein
VDYKFSLHLNFTLQNKYLRLFADNRPDSEDF